MGAGRRSIEARVFLVCLATAYLLYAGLAHMSAPAKASSSDAGGNSGAGMERTLAFDVTHASNQGYPSIARMDALTAVCGERDPGYRQSAATLWKPDDMQETFAEKYLQEFLTAYDESYARDLTLFQSNPDLFCAKEVIMEYRRDAGWWLQASGDPKYDGMVAETRKFTQTLDDESWKQLNACKVREIYSTMTDCWCQAEKVNQARANGDARSTSAIAYAVESECPGVRWKTYSYQFNRCENFNKGGRDYDCQCQASEFADLFEKNPARATNHLSRLATKAMAICQ